jgi:hypothetical protein
MAMFSGVNFSPALIGLAATRLFLATLLFLISEMVGDLMVCPKACST